MIPSFWHLRLKRLIAFSTRVNIFNNSGLDAEQSVMHTHFHIVPRVSGDGYKINPASVKQNFDLNKIANELKLN